MNCKFYFFFAILFFRCASAEIAVVTIAAGDNYRTLVKEGLANKLSYCLKNNYKYIEGSSSLDTSRPVPWSKILLILEVMKDPAIKWIFWTDADSLIMNQKTLLESLIDEDFEFIIGDELNATVNSGQFLIKNCEWSKKFLHQIYSHVEFVHHEWWENQAIIYEIENSDEIKSHTKIIPQRFINSYPRRLSRNLDEATYQDGDFIIHFPSIKGGELKHLMQHYSKRAKNHSKKPPSRASR